MAWYTKPPTPAVNPPRNRMRFWRTSLLSRTRSKCGTSPRLAGDWKVAVTRALIVGTGARPALSAAPDRGAAGILCGHGKRQAPGVRDRGQLQHQGAASRLPAGLLRVL